MSIGMSNQSWSPQLELLATEVTGDCRSWVELLLVGSQRIRDHSGWAI